MGRTGGGARGTRAGRLLALLGVRDLASARFVRAPGRVNLIGDHTDYQDGWCLPMAIDRDVLVATVPRADGRVTVRSLDLPGAASLAADGATDPATVEPAWSRLAAGATRVLARHHTPAAAADVAIGSTVPVGSGLASSAACTVGLLAALADPGAGRGESAPLAGVELARAAQQAEQLATGVPCGVMDQMACVFGRAGHALLVDCRALTVEALTLPPAVAVLVVHSGLPRTLAGSAYAERRARTEAAAIALGVPTLRDASERDVRDDPVARHVVTENARVLAFADALRDGDTGALGPLMLASHASLRDDFGVSTPELDRLVELLVAQGALGARLTGAGFGGCVVALVAPERVGTVAASVTDRYRAETGHEPTAFPVRATAGAGPSDDGGC